jgi:hypothetical protein
MLSCFWVTQQQGKVSWISPVHCCRVLCSLFATHHVRAPRKRIHMSYPQTFNSVHFEWGILRTGWKQHVPPLPEKQLRPACKNEGRQVALVAACSANTRPFHLLEAFIISLTTIASEAAPPDRPTPSNPPSRLRTLCGSTTARASICMEQTGSMAETQRHKP